MMYVGFAAIALFCLLKFPVSAAIASIDNPALLKLDGGQGLLAVTSFMILGAWTLVDPGFHQRVSAAATPKLGRKGVLVSVGFWALFDLMSITIGLYALTLLKPAPTEPLQIFPLFADRVLPPGLKGIFIAGLIGTILSGLVGYTLVSGASLGREIVGRLRPNSSDAQIRAWTRAGLFIASVLAIGIGLVVHSVVQLWYDWAGLLVGALLLPVAGAYGLLGRCRLAYQWVAASMIFAFCGSLGWMIYGKRCGNEFLQVEFGKQTFSLGTLVPSLAISALVIGIGEAFGRKTGDG
jgi:SSS family solute:Na+ symporter